MGEVVAVVPIGLFTYGPNSSSASAFAEGGGESLSERARCIRYLDAGRRVWAASSPAKYAGL